MEKIKAWGSSIGNYIKALYQSTDKEFKLANVKIPDLYKIKRAHRELLNSYSNSIAAVSRLSFFVGMTEVKPPEADLFTRILRIMLWGRFSPFRILIWRPVVELYVEMHVYEKLKILETIYAQAEFLIPELHYEKVDYLAWLRCAKEDCRQFSHTVTSGNIIFKTIQFVSIAVVSLLATIWGAANVFDLIIKMISSPPLTGGIMLLGRFVVFTIFAFPFLLIFLDVAFSSKRAIFLNINLDKKDIGNVYKLENDLFALLNHGKLIEFPLDYSVSAFYFLLFFAYIWLLHIGISRLPLLRNAIVVDCTWCFLILFVILFFSEVVIPWWQRANKGEM